MMDGPVSFKYMKDYEISQGMNVSVKLKGKPYSIIVDSPKSW